MRAAQPAMTGMDKYQHVYTSQTLIGNWWEERHDSTNKLDADRRLLRTGRIGETPIKMETVPPLTDMYDSINTKTYRPPAPLRPDSRVTMADSSALIYSQSDVPEAPDFANPVPRHTKDRHHRELSTTMHSSFGGAYAADPEMKEQIPAPEQRTLKGGFGAFNGHEYPGTGSKLDAPVAGVKTHQIGKRGGGVKIFGATGEVMKVGPGFDPKEHTFVQRSWDYNGARYVSEHTGAVVDGGGPNIEGCQLRGLGTSNEAVPELSGRQTRARKNDALSQDTGIWRSD